MPRVGVGTIILRDDKVLMGKRKNSHGDGYWGFSGGHLELFESFEECAKRETLEETGLVIEVIKELAVVTNDFFKAEIRHYATVFVRANYVNGEAKILEPDKCEEWKWFKWDEMPENLFVPIKNLKEEGYNPFER
jgi:8-oxo-dGTP diphosphatase